MGQAVFKRRTIVIESAAPIADELHGLTVDFKPDLKPEPVVLLLNSSQEMAKEMTLQLTLTMPGCSIMYAPSIDIAKWILGRRKIDLLVSCPLLPDGNINRLQTTLDRLPAPPDLVVVGELSSTAQSKLKGSRYEVAEFRRLGRRNTAAALSVQEPASAPKNSAALQQNISTVGANLRNDLNNPLQEIVAMVFVAQATGPELNEGTKQALLAIDHAAKNMAKVVGGLEDKIRLAVTPGSARSVAAGS